MHDGISCDYFDVYKDDPDQTLRMWMQMEKDVKHCPKCKQVIQKNGGCNHVTCRCGAHICWVCDASFQSSGECYGHLEQKHGSSY